MENIKLTYDDVTIVPSVVTNIESRSECCPYSSDGFISPTEENNFLPIIAAPMSSVVSLKNTKDFNDSKIRVVIPRSIPLEERFDRLFEDRTNFIAFSLNEVKDIFVNEDSRRNIKFHLAHDLSIVTLNICIDLANGHMNTLLETIKEIKDYFGKRVLIMSGNIANPKTYQDYDRIGCDFVRVSIGTGNVCSTSSNTGVHYPVFSLLKEIYEIKQSISGKCKIIADGGIKSFRDIQKALIYADYVMIGSLFNKAIESAGKTTYGNFYWNIRGKKVLRPIATLFHFGREVPKKKYQKVLSLIKKGKLDVYKEFYGMSTKIAQSLINEANGIAVNKLKTSEGLLKYQKVEYDVAGWVENEIDYLRSAMSYTNSKTLSEYKNSSWTRCTNISYNK